tara:strand:+ start:1673 stop:1975 length:303 start_codon:yes stop_codon:yes gene_type:complete
MKNVAEIKELLFQASMFHFLSSELDMLDKLGKGEAGDNTPYYQQVAGRYDEIWQILALENFELLSHNHYLSACAVAGFNHESAKEACMTEMAFLPTGGAE